jgi:predicted outer membrane repeat protein
MSSIHRVIGLTSVLLVLSACGGGGSSSGDSGTQPLPPTTPPTPTYLVTPVFGGNGLGTIAPASATVTEGQTASFQVTPDEGSSIASVTGCGGTLSGNTYTTGAINADCQFTATFNLNTYTVTASAGVGGALSPTSQTVDHGTRATFTVTPETGYSINTVSGCAGSLDGNTYTTGPVNDNCTVSATFNLNTYTVTATAGHGGSISPTSVNVTHGDSAAFSITPSIGYAIDSVSGCGGSLNGSAYTTGPITTSCTVEANFSELPPLVQCISNADELTAALSNVESASRAQWLHLVSGRIEGTFLSRVPSAITLKIEGGFSSGCVSKDLGAATELDGAQQGITMVVLLGEESQFYLSEMVISNGLNESPPSEGGAAGLYIGDPANNGAYTAAAYIEKTQFNSNILRNGNFAAGGLYAEVGFLRIANSRFQNNSGHQGGGAFAMCTECEILSSEFVGNSATRDAGGLFVRTDARQIAVDVSSKYIVIDDTLFNRNIAASNGGGLYAQTENQLQLTDSIFVENSAEQNRGGAAEIALAPNWSDFDRPVDSASLEMSRNFFIGNNAGDAGGGLSVNSVGPFLIANNIFQSNSTTRLPPDPFTTGTEHGGGGVYALLQERAVDTLGMRFVNNTFIANKTDSRGGAIYSRNGSNSSPTVYTNNVVFENLASGGSAYYIEPDYPGDFVSAPLRIEHNAFEPGATVTITFGVAEQLGNIEITQEAFEDFSGSAFQPAAGSPLIDAGLLTDDVPNTDILGSPRHGVPDIGAYER